MIFLNNFNKFFMSKDKKPINPDKSDDKVSDNDPLNIRNLLYYIGNIRYQNNDYGVPYVFPPAIISKVIQKEFKDDELIKRLGGSIKDFETLEFKTSEKTAFSKAVPKAKSGGEELDASDSQAGQKRKKTDSPANYGRPGNSAGGFSASRGRGLGGVGGSSSNGAGVTNSGGWATSSSPIDSQDESNQLKADLAKKARKLIREIVRELAPLQPFKAYVNQEGPGPMILRSTLKIDRPVDPWTSLNPNVDQPPIVNDGRVPNPGGGFSAFRSAFSIRSSIVGGLGGVRGGHSNGGVGGVGDREPGTSSLTSEDGSEVNSSLEDYDFLRGVENLEQLQRDSGRINQSRASHQQEAPSSPTASSSSSSMPSSLKPSESPASTSVSPGLGGVNNQLNNAMGGLKE